MELGTLLIKFRTRGIIHLYMAVFCAPHNIHLSQKYFSFNFLIIEACTILFFYWIMLRNAELKRRSLKCLGQFLASNQSPSNSTLTPLTKTRAQTTPIYLMMRKKNCSFQKVIKWSVLIIWSNSETLEPPCLSSESGD